MTDLLLFCIAWGSGLGALGLGIVIVCEVIARLRLWGSKK